MADAGADTVAGSAVAGEEGAGALGTDGGQGAGGSAGGGGKATAGAESSPSGGGLSDATGGVGGVSGPISRHLMECVEEMVDQADRVAECGKANWETADIASLLRDGGELSGGVPGPDGGLDGDEGASANVPHAFDGTLDSTLTFDEFNILRAMVEEGQEEGAKRPVDSDEQHLYELFSTAYKVGQAMWG